MGRVKALPFLIGGMMLTTADMQCSRKNLLIIVIKPDQRAVTNTIQNNATLKESHFVIR